MSGIQGVNNKLTSFGTKSKFIVFLRLQWPLQSKTVLLNQYFFLDVFLILLFYEEMNHDFNTLNAITVIFNII
ncbi:hypothetical protein P4J23_22410 [Bacillus cereus]|uniref:DALR domain-containing protein n=1 Tax=Bacillus cereus TaxID=1396 RepID=UPI002DBE897A|nr:hypothetical protein [Bacillus cereus]